MKEIKENDIKNPQVRQMMEEHKQREKKGYYVRVDSNTLVFVRKKSDEEAVIAKFMKRKKDMFGKI